MNEKPINLEDQSNEELIVIAGNMALMMRSHQTIIEEIFKLLSKRELANKNIPINNTSRPETWSLPKLKKISSDKSDTGANPNEIQGKF
jgi:hypothetical protein